MRLTPVVLLFFTACASTSNKPESYDYSGATPTPPVHTPAGAGAPMRGQPGAIDPDRPTLPRGKNKRPLPSEDQPGLWAADGAQFSAADSQEWTEKLAHVQRQCPSNTPQGASPEMYARCWADITALLMMSPEPLKQLNVDGIECLRARLMGECGNWLLGQADHYREHGGGKNFLKKYFPRGEWSTEDWNEGFRNRELKRCRNTGQMRSTETLYRLLGATGRDHKGWQSWED